jgi:acetyl esterase/lipase
MSVATLVWCHGGCFSGGSVEYDKELREYLSSCGIQVLPVDFSLESWDQAVKDVYKAYDNARWDNDNVIIGGISSGAMMAHYVAVQQVAPAILICPVLKPATRHSSLPEDMQARQLKFFGTFEKMMEAQTSLFREKVCTDRYILYGTKDERAPVSGFQELLGASNVTYDALNGGHGICISPPCELIEARIRALIRNIRPIT